MFWGTLCKGENFVLQGFCPKWLFGLGVMVWWLLSAGFLTEAFDLEPSWRKVNCLLISVMKHLLMLGRFPTKFM